MDDPIVCRCEGITLNRLKEILEQHDVQDLTEARILTRAGMGECQGRVCGVLVTRLLAERTGRAISELEPPRVRDPVRLVPVSEFQKPVDPVGAALPEGRADSHG